MLDRPLVGMNALNNLSAETLDRSIQTVVDYGFDCMELSISALPLIIGGEVCETVLNHAKSVLNRHPIQYTAHIGTGLDLRNLENYELHKRVLTSSIDICAALGMDRLTLHFENASPIQREEDAFFDAHSRAADYAAQKGILLLIENIEIEDYKKVLHMVQKVGKDNFKMTLDTGHLYLSTRYFGGNFLAAVRECAPYVRHVHLNDNTGRFEKMRLTDFAMYKTLNMNMRTAFGAGDIHVPPFWGNAPLEAAIHILHDANYNGIFLCEYDNTSYVPWGGQIQEKVRSIVQKIYND